MATHAAHHDGHDPDVAHHFENADQQFQSANLGMWVFLATEILFFGGLFCAYSVYRANHPEIFMFAHHFLDKNLGAVNTIVLICSSFTMAWAVRAAQLGQRRILQGMLALTLLFACGFLGIKYVEYSHKWHTGLLWASRYDPHVEESHGAGGETHGDATETHGEVAASDQGVAMDASATQDPGAAAATADAAADGATASGGEAAAGPERSNIAPAAEGPAGLAADGADAVESQPEAEPANAQVFFSIYFLMTGLHGIHVLGGMGAMIWLLALAARGAFDGGKYTRVHMVGLYWHLVDLIWIYLFLLLYLIH